MGGERRRFTIAGLTGLVLACCVALAAYRVMIVVLISGLLAIGTSRILLWLAEIRATRARWFGIAAGLLVLPVAGVLLVAARISWAGGLKHPDVWFYYLSESLAISFLTQIPAMVVAAIVGAFRWRKMRREPHDMSVANAVSPTLPQSDASSARP